VKFEGFSQSNTSSDLIILPINEKISLNGNKKVQVVKDLYAKIHGKR
jgi:hypothetical protein